MIVGIAGKAGSGKDEFAKVAREEFGAIHLSFASQLKEEVEDFLKKYQVIYHQKNLYGTAEDKEGILSVRHGNYPSYFTKFLSQFADYTNGKWFFTARSLMQWFGTFRRDSDENYWVNAALNNVDNDRLYVISDVRYWNEAEAIVAAGGKLVRIERPDAPSISNENHASEVGLNDWKKWDAKVINGGTLSEYQSFVRMVMKEFLNVSQ